MCIIVFHHHHCPQRCFTLFSRWEETQRVYMTCPGSHSQNTDGEGFEIFLTAIFSILHIPLMLKNSLKKVYIFLGLFLFFAPPPPPRPQMFRIKLSVHVTKYPLKCYVNCPSGLQTKGGWDWTYSSSLLLPTKYLITIDQPDVSMSHIILRAEQEPLRSGDNQETALWELTSYE